MANVGDYLTIKGVKKRWAGENYGWQTPASYSQLEKQGKFKVGAQFLDRLGSYLGPALQQVQGFQQQVRKVTSFLDPVENVVNRAVVADDRLPSSRVAIGGAVAAQRAGNVLNIDPRIAGIGGLLIGGVHTSGPKAGTYKWRPTGDLKPHVDAIEERIEAAHHHFKKHGTLSKGDFNRDILDANGNVVARATNQGNVDFERRTGISPRAVVSKPAAAVKPNVSTTVTKAVEEYGVPTPAAKQIIQRAESTDLAALRQQLIDAGLPDPQQRFSPQRTAKSTDRELGDLALRDPRLRRDLPPPSTSKQGLVAPVNVADTKAAKDRANSVVSQYDEPWNLEFKVSHKEAHHRSPLKDGSNFIEGWKTADVNDLTSAAFAQQVFLGDTQLNNEYLRKIFHTGNKSYPSTLDLAAHQVLIRKGLQADAQFIDGASVPFSRWEFIKQLPISDQKKYIPFFLEDAKENIRIAREAAFNQYQLQPPKDGVKVNDPKLNPFSGTFSQEVLAPDNKERLRIVKNALKQARDSLK